MGEIKLNSVYSTVKINPGAGPGEVSLWIQPQGQSMDQILGEDGIHDPETLNKSHTNVTQAGQLGNAIGDLRLKRFWAEVTGAPADVEKVRSAAILTVEIGGKKVGKYSLSFTVGDLDLKVHRNDTFFGRLSIDRKLDLSGPVYVLAVFDGETWEPPKKAEKVSTHCVTCTCKDL